MFRSFLKKKPSKSYRVLKHTDVASVLSQFGPSRLTKSSDQTVSEFYYDWHSQIPDIMKPSTDDEYKNLADLVLRAMFYISIIMISTFSRHYLI